MTSPRTQSNTALDEIHALQAENAQLKITIMALREQLEQARIERDQGVQQAVVNAKDELTQLRGTVTSLRDGLERNSATYEEKIQNLERVARDEARQLQETIRLLRDQLEGRGA
jgi:chromosome segregation ATPase